MTIITKDMKISEVLELGSETVPIFLKNGMHCLGCPSSSKESLEDACAVHGISVDKLVNELNEYFKNRNDN